MGDYADGKPYGGHQAHRLIVQADEQRTYWHCKCGGDIANSLDRCCFCGQPRPDAEVNVSSS